MRHDIANGFWTGFFAPLRGLRLIAVNPRLRIMALFPFFISVLVFVVGGILGVKFILIEYSPLLTAKILGYVGVATHAGFWYWLTLLVFVWPVLLFALLYALYVTARILASPFFSLLAERVLIEEKVLADVPFSALPWLGASIKMFLVSIAKAVVFILLGSVLFVFSFIPGVNLLSSLGFLLIVAFDMMDYSFEAMQMSLGERFAFFRRHFPVFLGFSFAMGLVFFIPGLSFFLFPASIVGGGDVVRRLVQASGRMSSR